MFDSEITIIGAGVVGLAIAETISANFRGVYLVEKNRSFGQETSSRNSEVIHAGIYYPHGSLKARLCVEGRELLYSYCQRWSVPFRQCGKLIVATSEDEITVINEIIKKGSLNGVNDLRVVERDEIAIMEPHISARKAIFSPSTGIIDSHCLMKQYETNFINNGGNIAYRCEVTGIRKKGNGYEVNVREAEGNEFTFTSRVVINSAGLYSDLVAGMAGISDESLEIKYCKGEYFKVRPPKNKYLKHLVYPVPHENLEGIGVHVTIDMGGSVKLGPDVTWLNERREDYSVDPAKQEAFFISAKRFLPFLEYDDLVPEMAGIRPKIQRPGGPVRDFYIREESNRGMPGFVNLIGIESPGLTSSLAIGRHVLRLINGTDK